MPVTLTTSPSAGTRTTVLPESAVSNACLCHTEGDYTIRYHPTPEYAIVECNNCLVWRTFPRPSEATLRAAYAADYPAFQPSMPATHGTGWRRVWTVPTLPAGANILELGAGSGRFVDWAARQGWRVTPVDGVGAAEQLAVTPGTFDAVVGWQFLEHTIEPMRVLCRARAALKSGGVLVLSVPNVDSVERRLFGAAWEAWQVPFHLWHFTPHTLRRLVMAVGFDVERIVHQRVFKGLRRSAAPQTLLGAAVAACHLSSRINLIARRP